jgi:hypothetical protein
VIKYIFSCKYIDLFQIRYTFEPPQLYQHYVASPAYSAPDLVAALDCGFKFYPSWDPCIPHLLAQPGVPLVFTEFTLQVLLTKSFQGMVTKRLGGDFKFGFGSLFERRAQGPRLDSPFSQHWEFLIAAIS